MVPVGPREGHRGLEEPGQDLEEPGQDLEQHHRKSELLSRIAPFLLHLDRPPTDRPSLSCNVLHHSYSTCHHRKSPSFRTPSPRPRTCRCWHKDLSLSLTRDRCCSQPGHSVSSTPTSSPQDICRCERVPTAHSRHCKQGPREAAAAALVAVRGLELVVTTCRTAGCFQGSCWQPRN